MGLNDQTAFLMVSLDEESIRPEITSLTVVKVAGRKNINNINN